ncbi:MAG: class I SAM-dependent methyltransferase [Nitriliruptorales bacterium]
MTDPSAIADFMDGEVCCRLLRGDDLGTVAGVSEVLLAALTSMELRGRSVLDIGCGAGGLAVQLLGQGVDHVTGLDLSPQAIAAAGRLSADRGFADRTTFRVGDAAETALPSADVVVLDKVYCCYFDPTRLLANSLGATGEVYAIVLPASIGPRGLASRVLLRVENLWHLVRRRRFRAYVHDVPRLDAAIRRAGFGPATVRHHRYWELRIYERTSA